MAGNRLTQADITVTCVYTYLCDALALSESWRIYPALSALAARCEALPGIRTVENEIRRAYAHSDRGRLEMGQNGST